MSYKLNETRSRALIWCLLSVHSIALMGETRVGRIDVRSLDVFSPSEAGRGWFYRAANSARIATRESVIRRFLLFREGDAYDPVRLEETERNLRSLPFLKSASVTSGAHHDGLVDIEVVTQDAWTTELGVSLGGKGGETTYGFDLKEKDVFGLGKAVAASYDRGIDRITRLFQYQDPYLFGPYWFGNATYAVNSDGRETRLAVGRPFFSFIDPWSSDLLVDDLSQRDRIFQNGRVVSLFRRFKRRRHALYGQALQARDDRAERLSVGIRDEQDLFSRIRGRLRDRIPDDRRFRYLVVRFAQVENNFVKLNFVNRDSRFEDFNLGGNVAVEVALSPRVFGIDRASGFVQLEASRGWGTGETILLAQSSYQTRWDRGPKNSILSGRIFFAQQLRSAVRQTLVSRIQVDRGWNLDPDVQFFADGEAGLRAYRIHAYEGDKRIVWNLEHRIFAGHEFLQLASPSLVVFFDAGAASPPGRSLRLSHFKSDFGVGLRLAISRAASGGILRVDAAYPVNANQRRRKWIVSFSSGQAF